MDFKRKIDIERLIIVGVVMLTVLYLTIPAVLALFVVPPPSGSCSLPDGLASIDCRRLR
jgi:hypothetical protein